MHYEPLKSDLSFQGLELRLNKCQSSMKALEKTVAGVRKEKNIRFYKDLSYLVHFIVTQPELKYIFDSILNGGMHIRNTKQYSDIQIELSVLIRRLITQLNKKKDLKEFENSGKKFPMLYKTKFLPQSGSPKTIFQDIKSLSSSQYTSNHISRIILTLRTICGEWFKKDEDWDFFLDQIFKIEVKQKELEYFDIFQTGFIGQAEAESILYTYKAFNPLIYPKIQHTDQNILLANIREGNFEAIISNDDLLNNAIFIVQEIRLNLNTRLGVLFLINQFRIFNSLYSEEVQIKPNPEKHFQYEFEKFAFQRGYYPLSEIQLKKARIDSLILDSNSAFLFEIKQIGFGIKSETKAQIIKKIRQSLTQSNTYIKQLQTLPHLKPEVNILIMTKYPIIFLNESSSLNIEGITYIFHLIELNSESASKKQQIEINLLKL